VLQVNTGRKGEMTDPWAFVTTGGLIRGKKARLTAKGQFEKDQLAGFLASRIDKK